MDKEKLTAQYKSDMKKHEKEMSELLSHKRDLEKKRQEMFDWKRKEMAHYGRLRDEMHGADFAREKKTIDNYMGSAQHICRKVEQRYEQDYDETERRRKKLSAQMDDCRSKYNRTMREIEKGGVGK